MYIKSPGRLWWPVGTVDTRDSSAEELEQNGSELVVLRTQLTYDLTGAPHLAVVESLELGVEFFAVVGL